VSTPNAPAGIDDDELPREVRVVWIPLACVLLVVVFFLAGLPTDRIGKLASQKLGGALGTRVTIGELGPGISLSGPVLAASDVRIELPGGAALVFAHARVRPAFSLRWLRGQPALAIDATGEAGSIHGTVFPSGKRGFEGTLADVDLARLPLGGALPQGSFEGRATATGDIHWLADGPMGAFELVARDGSLSLPALPIALPYATLRATIAMTDAALADVQSFALDGPMVAATITGTVGRAPVLTAAPLALEARIETREASLRPMLQSAGLRPDANGVATVKVGGSIGQPSVR
jgi:type II secretion system protein N